MISLRRNLRQFARIAAHAQMMPVLESGDDPLIGGQAVIEGVMMRAPHSYCVAVRKPDGTVAAEQMPIQKPSETRKIWGWPGLRGLATLGQALKLGFRALRFSATHAIEEPEKDSSKADATQKKNDPVEIPGWMMALNIAFSIGFFIFLYKFVPLYLTTLMQNYTDRLDGAFSFSLIDGLIRLAIFLAFLTLISRMNDIRRVFQYHGAEHKVVFNYESGEDVNVSRAQSFTTFHPRCGTSFLMVVMIVSIFVYALVPFDGFGPKMLSRVVLLPLIAGISYEVIRFASRRGSKMMTWLVAPGLWLQRITTKNPADDQVEISIQALEGAMRLEEEQNGDLVIA